VAGNFQNRLRRRTDSSAVLRPVFLSAKGRERTRKEVLLAGGRADREAENGGQNRAGLRRHSFGVESSYLVLDAHRFEVEHALYFYKKLQRLVRG